MRISNLNSILQGKISHKGSTYSISGLALKAKEVKPGFAFFSNDEEEINKAIQLGAYAIISQKELKITNNDIYYIQTDDFKRSLQKLLRFISLEKNYNFLLCNKIELKLAKHFNIKILDGNIIDDFDFMIKAPPNSFFVFDDEAYLLGFCAFVLKLEKIENIKIIYNSLICTSIFYNDLIFKNLHLPFAYAEFFASFVAFTQKHNINFNTDKKDFDFLNIFSIDQHNHIMPFASTYRAFIVVDDYTQFKYLIDKLAHINGLKIAGENTLFCDFSYNDLKELKNFKDFRYCLLHANKDEFIKIFTKEEDHTSLFDMRD